MARVVECIVLLVIAEITFAFVNNTQIEMRNDLEDQETRRKIEKKERSTSSSSGDLEDSRDSGADSLDLSVSNTASSDLKKKKKNDNKPKSSEERRGWRKWHRKCNSCPEEMRLKWRDPSIKWICGAYQRARRSFKSLCMMHYRNCQDGTMFIKIHDHRCANSSMDKPHGDHFFYEYRAVLSDDNTNSKTVTDSSSFESSSDD